MHQVIELTDQHSDDLTNYFGIVEDEIRHAVTTLPVEEWVKEALFELLNQTIGDDMGFVY